ncbi:MAG: phosphatidylserine decarboxylase [Candidatus Omnitrophota bacterium]
MHPYIIIFGHHILVYNLMAVLGYAMASYYWYRAGAGLHLSRSWLFFAILSGFMVQLYGGMVIPFLYRKFILHQNPMFNLLRGCPGRFFHSCFLSVLVYFILISRALKWPVKKIMDNFMVSAMIMSTIGRIGCLAQGCCIGKPANVPWAIRFPFNPGVAVHPAQIYMFFSELAIMGFLMRLQKQRRYDGQTFWTGIFLYSIYRFLIEFYRTNPIFLYGLTHAQFFSIITFSISGFYLYFKEFGIVKRKQPYVVWLLAIGLVVLAANLFLGIFLLAFATFIAFFFRDPERAIPLSEKAILSPADGRLTDIALCDSVPSGPYTRISIYLSLFDVHTTRSPVSGIVESIIYSPGKFHFAFNKNKAADNENNLIAITNSRFKIMVRQISGKLIRRISCYCKKNDLVRQGDRIGIIEFGSCVQVYIPRNFKIKAKIGEKIRGGETILAVLEE